MKRQERRGAEGDGDLSDASGTEEERPESAEEPVAQRQAGRPPATTTKDDELLLEHEILGDHRSHATGATQLRGHDGEVEQGEQEVLHARVSVGQTPRATQRCPIRESARELAIRDAQVSAPVVIIGEVALQVALQRALVQHNDVIEALASKGANHALNERILPGSNEAPSALLRCPSAARYAEDRIRKSHHDPG